MRIIFPDPHPRRRRDLAGGRGVVRQNALGLIDVDQYRGSHEMAFVLSPGRGPNERAECLDPPSKFARSRFLLSCSFRIRGTDRFLVASHRLPQAR